jgi:hypothetical protein
MMPPMPMSSTTPALTTRVKHLINRVLNPLGFEMITTRKRLAENRRLNSAEQRGHWSVPRYTAGIHFEDAKYLEFLNSVSERYQSSYNQLPQMPNDAGSSEEFYLNNGWFESVDAEILYSMIRLHQPKTIIEVGSGNSTRLMRRSIQDGKLNTRIVSIDPQPRVEMAQHTDEYLALRVEALPVNKITETLVPGDILFIDSSHQIVTAGDVPFLVLEVGLYWNRAF